MIKFRQIYSGKIPYQIRKNSLNKKNTNRLFCFFPNHENITVALTEKAFKDLKKII
jgi:hypothetical protein